MTRLIKINMLKTDNKKNINVLGSGFQLHEVHLGTLRQFKKIFIKVRCILLLFTIISSNPNPNPFHLIV